MSGIGDRFLWAMSLKLPGLDGMNTLSLNEAKSSGKIGIGFREDWIQGPPMKANAYTQIGPEEKRIM